MYVVDKVGFSFRAAKKSKSPAELVNELVNYGFFLSDETRAFAEEVYARVPRKTAVVNVSSLMALVLLFSLRIVYNLVYFLGFF